MRIVVILLTLCLFPAIGLGRSEPDPTPAVPPTEQDFLDLPLAEAARAPVLEKRQALIIGNSHYEMGTIPTSANDARAVVKALEDLGFQTIWKTDCDSEEMDRLIQEFAGRLSEGSTALVYFSGHALRAKGKNYLVPVGSGESEKEIHYRCVSVEHLFSVMADRQAGVSLVFLDACREDNPYAQAYADTEGPGLAMMAIQRGQLLCFSNAPGQTVPTGPGQYSTFTRNWLKALRNPNLTIDQLLTKVREETAVQTGNMQLPWYVSLLTEPFYFHRQRNGQNDPATPDYAAQEPLVDTSALDAVIQEEQAFKALFQKAREYFRKLEQIEQRPPANEEEAKKRHAAWDAYLRQFGQAKHGLDEARRYRDFYANWSPDKGRSQPGKNYVEDLGGGVELDMIWVPGGSFLMGGRLGPEQAAREYGGKPEWYRGERPVHLVRLEGFWISRTEITNAQFRRYAAGHNSGEYEGLSLNSPDQPVAQVSWQDAQNWRQWLSQKTGAPYALPTEAEWEYAARAGTGRPRYWDQLSSAGLYANTADLAARENWPDWETGLVRDGFPVSSPAGYFKANAFGLHDMLGNVWEWCADWYDGGYYKFAPGENPTGPDDGVERVIRGGSWSTLPLHCRSAYRQSKPPDTASPTIGFRVVRRVEKK